MCVVVWVEHTNKFCQRKPKCVRCEGNHSSQDCNSECIDKALCPYCSLKHAANIDVCTHFKTINSSFSRVEQSKIQSKYAEAVAAACMPTEAESKRPHTTSSSATVQTKVPPSNRLSSTTALYASVAGSSAVIVTHNRFAGLVGTVLEAQQKSTSNVTSLADPIARYKLVMGKILESEKSDQRKPLPINTILRHTPKWWWNPELNKKYLSKKKAFQSFKRYGAHTEYGAFMAAETEFSVLKRPLKSMVLMFCYWNSYRKPSN